MRHGITERPSHGKSRNVFCFEPDSQWSKWVTMLISVWIDSAIVCNNPISFILIIWFMITSKSFTSALAVGISSTYLWFRLNYDTSWITNICHKQFSTNSHNTNACRTTVSGVLRHIADILLGFDKCFFQRLEDNITWRVILWKIVLSQILFHFNLYMVRKTMLHKTTYLSAILSMPIAYWEEVTMFQT